MSRPRTHYRNKQVPAKTVQEAYGYSLNVPITEEMNEALRLVCFQQKTTRVAIARYALENALRDLGSKNESAA